jgi:hypothetical protein
MKNNILFFSLFLLILFISSCKKENLYSKWKIGGYIYQYGADIPIEGVTITLKRINNCGDFINGCDDIPYKDVTTDSTGAYYINPGVTTSIDFWKDGYWFGSNNGSYPGFFGPPAKTYLNKNALVKIHISNTGATKIDSIQINFPFNETQGVILIGQHIDTTVTATAAGDAQNIFHWTFLTQEYIHVGNEKADSFYVKSGDTALVDIKAH